jgi:hypothetical protein
MLVKPTFALRVPGVIPAKYWHRPSAFCRLGWHSDSLTCIWEGSGSNPEWSTILEYSE